jgi:hypothetical protein
VFWREIPVGGVSSKKCAQNEILVISLKFSNFFRQAAPIEKN